MQISKSMLCLDTIITLFSKYVLESIHCCLIQDLTSNLGEDSGVYQTFTDMRLTRHITDAVKAYTGYRKLSRLQPELAAAKMRFNIVGCADGSVINSKNILEGYLIKKKKNKAVLVDNNITV